MNSEEIIKLVSALKNAGCAVTVVPDLCKTAVSDVGQMTAFARTTVVACYPRAVSSIFDRMDLKPKRLLDIRNHSCEQIWDEMGVVPPVFVPEASIADPLPEEERAWYPVIDRERCTKCGKCHDFCLFGVYSVSEGTVKVTQPQNCKDNCPACARLCPAKAIIFPKYEKSPINGGLHDEEPLGETDTRALYNVALKQKLAERRAKVSLFKKKEQ
jgi:NAD-dependent dihydropyrimidine dehydrogenase PreA subunit